VLSTAARALVVVVPSWPPEDAPEEPLAEPALCPYPCDELPAVPPPDWVTVVVDPSRVARPTPASSAAPPTVAAPARKVMRP
jgi:hypothetical protein